jgi:hypothetical protein
MVFISIQESKDLSKLTIEKLMGSLLSHESRINMEEESLEHSFNTEAFISNGRGRGNIGKGNHQTKERTTP